MKLYYLSPRKNIAFEEEIEKKYKKLNKNNIFHISKIEKLPTLNICDVLIVDDDINLETTLSFFYMNAKIYIRFNYSNIFTNYQNNLYLQEKRFVLIKSKRQIRFNQKIKRVFDIVISSFFILLFSPLFLITAVLVKVTSKGTIIYKQERIGLNCKKFDIYKFRSMIMNSEGNTPKLVKENDPRLTFVGSFIRKYKIDELPQLINILRGDMSIVGPRPERNYFVQKYNKTVPYYSYRFIVKPGLISLSHIHGSYFTDVSIRILYDLEYIIHYNFIKDLKLIFKTVPVVLNMKGRL